jgi:hypothetical protein
MNMKKGLVIGLLVVTVLSLCVVNVTAALPRNPTVAPHSKIVTDVKTTIPTNLTFTCPTHVKVNEPFSIGGVLKTEGDSGVSGAQIDVQEVKQGQWTTISGYTTDSSGNIVGSITVNSIGLYRYRLAFPGMDQYDPTESDVEIVTVSE